jgi:hypothetical protein
MDKNDMSRSESALQSERWEIIYISFYFARHFSLAFGLQPLSLYPNIFSQEILVKISVLYQNIS